MKAAREMHVARRIIQPLREISIERVCSECDHVLDASLRTVA